MTYVNDLEASLHDENTVFAVLNNHKRGDFLPYVYKSTNRGRSWTSITGDLPERGSAYTIVQDHVNPSLLFVGTEFGIFATLNGGTDWIQLEGDMPTIAVRDLEIQRRENDLVAASFGRSFFVLDDYTPLRELSTQLLEADAHIFPIKTADLYIQRRTLGGGEKASLGSMFYTAPNPPFGATFTIYLKDSLKTSRAQRQERERNAAKEGEDTPYPNWEALKAEDREEDPVVILTIRDQTGAEVRRINGPTSSGMHRLTWDLRYPGFGPISMNSDGRGPLVVPGTYTVEIHKRVDGVTTELAPATPFEVEVLGTPTLPPADRQALLAFQMQVGELQRAVQGAGRAAADAEEQIQFIKRAIEISPQVDGNLLSEARSLELRLMDLQEAMNGDRTLPRRGEAAMPGIQGRIRTVIFGSMSSTSAPTATQQEGYRITAALFTETYDDLKQLIEVDLPAFQQRLEAAGVPWTPGRGMPDWSGGS